jgi:peptidoglycan/LPS O-acetylase OafA/YrhL
VWNDPAWSISAEAAAYLLFPLLALATDWRRWSTLALVGVAAAILAALHLLMRGEPHLGADIARFALVRCLAEFTVGGIVCALWLRRPPIGAALAVAAACLAAWALGAPETFAVPAAFAALLLLLALTAGRPGNLLESRVLHGLGEWSYATYLSHFLLWKAWKLAVVSGPVTALQLAGYLLLVLVASALLYRYLELPAQAWINRTQPVRRRNDSPTPRIS